MKKYWPVSFRCQSDVDRIDEVVKQKQNKNKKRKTDSFSTACSMVIIIRFLEKSLSLFFVVIYLHFDFFYVSTPVSRSRLSLNQVHVLA